MRTDGMRDSVDSVLSVCLDDDEDDNDDDILFILVKIFQSVTFSMALGGESVTTSVQILQMAV